MATERNADPVPETYPWPEVAEMHRRRAETWETVALWATCTGLGLIVALVWVVVHCGGG